jgi:hypothetical protein
MRVARSLLCLSVLGIAAAGLGAEDSFGTMVPSYVTVGSADLQPENPSQSFVRGNGLAVSSGTFHANPKLPSGALLTSLSMDLCDADGGLTPVLDWRVLDRFGQQVTSGSIPALVVGAGCASLNVAVSTDVPIDNWANRLLLSVSVAEEITLNGLVVGYLLQVSPAPKEPTFGDVPTNDFGYQYIEALVASGITAGCGDENYCPDSPVTRRQMAIFLAKALGLQWP